MLFKIEFFGVSILQFFINSAKTFLKKTIIYFYQIPN